MLPVGTRSHLHTKLEGNSSTRVVKVCPLLVACNVESQSRPVLKHRCYYMHEIYTYTLSVII